MKISTRITNSKASSVPTRSHRTAGKLLEKGGGFQQVKDNKRE